MKDFFYIIIGAVLVNNVVMVKGLGICPLFDRGMTAEPSTASPPRSC